MMDRKYFELAIRLNETAKLAMYVAKNINYNPSLNKPNDDNLEWLLLETQDLNHKIESIISGQMKDCDGQVHCDK